MKLDHVIFVTSIPINVNIKFVSIISIKQISHFWLFKQVGSQNLAAEGLTACKEAVIGEFDGRGKDTGVHLQLCVSWVFRLHNRRKSINHVFYESER